MKVLLEKIDSLREIVEVKFENVNREIKDVHRSLKSIKDQHDADIQKTGAELLQLDNRMSKQENNWSYLLGASALVSVVVGVFIAFFPAVRDGWILDVLRGDIARDIVIKAVEDEFFITE